MEEIWRPIPTMEDRYEVSNLGRVRNINTDHILKITYPTSGQCSVCIPVKGSNTVYPVKYLVACAFLGVDITSNTKPKIRHKDRDYSNIQLDNLEIVDTSDLVDEHWKDIKGFEGIYQVSDKGRVKRLAREETYIQNDTGQLCKRRYPDRLIKPTITSGYYEVNLCHKDHSEYHRIHRLVALAFISNPDNLSQVNHIDGDKFNNCKENLEWCTECYNVQHAIDTGLRKSPPKGVYRGPVRVRCDQTNQIFKSMREAAECMNIKYNYLNERIRMHKSCHGYTFTILKDEEVTIH